MSREVYVRFSESRGSDPPATHLVILVHGRREDTQALSEDVARVLATMGLRPSAKTQVVHMSDGFGFLGFRIRWKRKEARTSGTSTPSSMTGLSGG